MMLEAFADDGHYALIYQARDRVLHHPLIIGKLAAQVVQIERIQSHDASTLEGRQGSNGVGAGALFQGLAKQAAADAERNDCE